MHISASVGANVAPTTSLSIKGSLAFFIVIPVTARTLSASFFVSNHIVSFTILFTVKSKLTNAFLFVLLESLKRLEEKRIGLF